MAIRSNDSSIQVRRIKGVALELELACLDFGKVQDIVDQRQQMLAAGTCGLDEFALTSVERGVGQQARHADDGVERGADFMAASSS